MSKPYIRVAAGLILQADGQLLLGQRPIGKPWEGWWELPGGKIEAGESVLQALARELHEELGITVTQSAPWVTYIHEYPKTIVELNFCKVTAWDGEPASHENQALAWVDPQQTLHVSPLLPATEPPLRWLRLPDRYLLTQLRSPDQLQAGLQDLAQRLSQGVRLVQFREPNWPDGTEADSLYAALQQTLTLCQQHGAQCLVNSVHPWAWAQSAHGLHLRAGDIARATPQTRPPGWLGVSVHDTWQIQAAQAVQADFMVLGHVLATPSHADQPPMGWHHFTQLAAAAGCPVYAIGGQSPATLTTAQQHGAHGIAGIRHV